MDGIQKVWKVYIGKYYTSFYARLPKSLMSVEGFVESCFFFFLLRPDIAHM